MLRKFRDLNGNFRIPFIVKKFRIKVLFEMKDIEIVRFIRYFYFAFRMVLTKGLIKSVKERSPVLRDGTPIPWVTHGFIDYVSRLNMKNMSMVEFGSGNSTLFFVKLVRSIVSYEHDEKYISHLRDQHGYMGEIVHVDHRYGGTPDDFRADIVFIDGLDRNRLLENLLRVINSDSIQVPSIIMIDNPDFVNQNLLGELIVSGFIRIDFYGLVSGNFEDGVSSLFLSKEVENQVFENLSSGNYHSRFT